MRFIRLTEGASRGDGLREAHECDPGSGRPHREEQIEPRPDQLRQAAWNRADGFHARGLQAEHSGGPDAYSDRDQGGGCAWHKALHQIDQPQHEEDKSNNAMVSRPMLWVTI